jgi:hypothetical protein
MNGLIHVKDGVSFRIIASAGFRLLEAIQHTARRLNVDLTITCACEAHPPTDPHALGEAYDLRTHGFDDDQKRAILRELMLELRDDTVEGSDMPKPASNGLVTRQFFGWIEHLGQPNEHIHVQRRHGIVYGLSA